MQVFPTSEYAETSPLPRPTYFARRHRRSLLGHPDLCCGSLRRVHSSRGWGWEEDRKHRNRLFHFTVVCKLSWLACFTHPRHSGPRKKKKSQCHHQQFTPLYPLLSIQIWNPGWVDGLASLLLLSAFPAFSRQLQTISSMK